MTYRDQATCSLYRQMSECRRGSALPSVTSGIELVSFTAYTTHLQSRALQHTPTVAFIQLRATAARRSGRSVPAPNASSRATSVGSCPRKRASSMCDAPHLRRGLGIRDAKNGSTPLPAGCDGQPCGADLPDPLSRYRQPAQAWSRRNSRGRPPLPRRRERKARDCSASTPSRAASACTEPVSGGRGDGSRIVSTNLTNFIQLRQNDRAPSARMPRGIPLRQSLSRLTLLAHRSTSSHNGELKSVHALSIEVRHSYSERLCHIPFHQTDFCTP
jgi:hypothetical protein